MTDYMKLIEALRCKVGITEEETKCEKCPYGTGFSDCDVERYCNDAAAAIEDMAKHITEMHERVTVLQIARGELEAEVKRLEPKRGEWIDSKERMRPDMCSACGCIYEADRFMDKIAWHYCPNCGAKMEVQE